MYRQDRSREGIVLLELGTQNILEHLARLRIELVVVCSTMRLGMECCWLQYFATPVMDLSTALITRCCEFAQRQLQGNSTPSQLVLLALFAVAVASGAQWTCTGLRASAAALGLHESGVEGAINGDIYLLTIYVKWASLCFSSLGLLSF